MKAHVGVAVDVSLYTVRIPAIRSNSLISQPNFILYREISKCRSTNLSRRFGRGQWWRRLRRRGSLPGSTGKLWERDFVLFRLDLVKVFGSGGIGVCGVSRVLILRLDGGVLVDTPRQPPQSGRCDGLWCEVCFRGGGGHLGSWGLLQSQTNLTST